MATRVFGPGVEPGGMDLDDNHDEDFAALRAEIEAEQEAEDREFAATLGRGSPFHSISE